MIKAKITNYKSDERTEYLRQIKNEVLNLTTSPLFKYRQDQKYWPVIGEGDHEAKIMFIGEAPGEREAKAGRPFCGRAGQFLDELLISVNISRASVYITNILKDRPPNNRDPMPAEIAIYAPFLNRQIAIIQPMIIVTLGRFAMQYIFDLFALSDQLQPISAIHGQVFKAQADYGPIKILPLYHPAAAIYNQDLKAVQLNDFKILVNYG